MLQDQNAFNHALYHLVTHWAAAVATFGLLATFTVILATASKSPSGFARWACVAIIILVFAGSVYFLLRMQTFGNWLNADDHLPTDYKVATIPCVPHPLNLLGGILISFILAALNLMILFCQPPAAK